MIWCLKRCCQHLSSKWRTLSFMNCLRCLQCTEWKGGTGCGLPTGAIWNCVTGKVLGPSLECEHNPLLTATTLQLSCLCVSMQVKCETKEFWKRGGKHADWIEKLATLRVYLRTLTSGLLLKQLIINLSYFPTPLWWDSRASRVGRDVKEWGTLCFPASHRSDPRWVDKEEACHRRRNKEPHSESKCAKETWESVPVTQGMVSGWHDLIPNATVTIIELYTKGSAKKTC